MKEGKLGCKIIRTDPDAADFNIYSLINQVRMDIKQSTIKSTRNSLIDDLSRELKPEYKTIKAHEKDY